jgi:molecular chaperone GrpE (heat shock protein)
MESEQEAKIQALKYRVDDLEPELCDLKTTFDRQLKAHKAKIESLTQSLVEATQKLNRALEALDRLYREGFEPMTSAEAISVLKDNGY